MNEEILNVKYKELLSKVDSYDEYFSSLNDIFDYKAWEKCLVEDNKNIYQKYLKENTKGLHRDEAQTKIDKFIRFEKNEANKKDKNTWFSVNKENTKIAYENYLRDYPNGLYVEEAKNGIKELSQQLENKKNQDNKAWLNSVRINTKQAYRHYLNLYHNGMYIESALNKINQLNQLEKERIRLKNEENKKLSEIERKKQEDISNDRKSWQLANQKSTLFYYKEYLKYYPNGLYKNEAKEKIRIFEYHNRQQEEKEKERNLERQKFQEIFDWADKYNLDDKTIPRDIETLKKLSYLSAEDKAIKELPNSIGNLNELMSIHLCGNELRELPLSIRKLKKLETLDLGENSFTNIPLNIIGVRDSLKRLYLNDNLLNEIPKFICNFKELESLYLYNNRLITLPWNIENLTRLVQLNIGGNMFTELPSTIENLQNLSRSTKDEIDEILRSIE